MHALNATGLLSLHLCVRPLVANSLTHTHTHAAIWPSSDSSPLQVLILFFCKFVFTFQQHEKAIPFTGAMKTGSFDVWPRADDEQMLDVL